MIKYLSLIFSFFILTVLFVFAPGRADEKNSYTEYCYGLSALESTPDRLSEPDHHELPLQFIDGVNLFNNYIIVLRRNGNLNHYSLDNDFYSVSAISLLLALFSLWGQLSGRFGRIVHCFLITYRHYKSGLTRDGPFLSLTI